MLIISKFNSASFFKCESLCGCINDCPDILCTICKYHAMKIKELNKISNKPSNSLLQTGILLQSKICLERERALDRGVDIIKESWITSPGNKMFVHISRAIMAFSCFRRKLNDYLHIFKESHPKQTLYINLYLGLLCMILLVNVLRIEGKAGFTVTYLQG